MTYGNYEEKDISNPSLRVYFDRDYILNSDWYKKRLVIKQQKDVVFYKKQIAYIEAYISDSNNISPSSLPPSPPEPCCGLPLPILYF